MGKIIAPSANFDIPTICKQARLIRGESQGQLAKRYGVTPGTVSRWETGKMCPSPKVFQKLYETVNGAK